MYIQENTFYFLRDLWKVLLPENKKEGRDYVKRKIYATLLVLIMLLLLSTTAFATETDSLPALHLQAATGEGETVVTVFLQDCDGVTNGRFVVGYDAEAFVLMDVTTSGAYAVSSVNDQTAGTVAFAWVGSQLTGEKTLMLTIRFRAVGEVSQVTTVAAESDGIYADGELVDVAGATVSAGLDTAALEQAIAKAEGLDKSEYTEKSFATVEDALQEAKEVLDDPNATQAEVDAAAQALNDAMAALKLREDNVDTGDSAMIILAVCLAAASAGGFAVLLAQNKRRDNV